jgi:hypothetical protein
MRVYTICSTYKWRAWHIIVQSQEFKTIHPVIYEKVDYQNSGIVMIILVTRNTIIMKNRIGHALSTGHTYSYTLDPTSSISIGNMKWSYEIDPFGYLRFFPHSSHWG